MLQTYLGGNCALSKVNIGEIDLSTLPGAIHTNCLFANSEDAQLDPNDTKCVNQADPDASVSIDFFGNPRPQGGAADIGYQELK